MFMRPPTHHFGKAGPSERSTTCLSNRTRDVRTAGSSANLDANTAEKLSTWLVLQLHLGGLASLGLTLMTGGLVALGERHEAVWDKLARTIVIDDPEGRYRP
mgnify:CR=1 FL=1